MRIGIDATLAGSRRAERGGIHRYLTQLLLGFQAVAGPDRFRLWFNACRPGRLDGVAEFLAGLDGLRPEVRISRFPGRVRDQLGIPVDRPLGPVDVFHSPSHVLPLLRRTPSVVTIHDLAFWRMPEEASRLDPGWCAAIGRRSADPAADLAAYRDRCAFFRRLRAEVPGTLARAHAIVAVSEATATDLVEIGRVPRARIRVVPNGLTPGMGRVSEPAALDAARRAARAPDGYVLYVGVFDPNKDLPTLLTAFARACPRLAPEAVLVLAGPRNWFQAVLEEEAARLGIGARVRFPGYVPDALLPALYSGAAAVVCPSPLEGFGLPALEAMACGSPVIVADAGALPEVAGEAALRVPPRDPEAMARAIERAATDRELAADLRRRGLARCRDFSWERTARMTLDVYREVAG